MMHSDETHGIPYAAVPHTGDLALRVRGRDLRELFINAARALFDVMSLPPHDTAMMRQLALDAVDTEALLVDWLNELIYLHEAEGETYTEFILDEFSPTHLAARVFGGPTVEQILVVKAATFHNLQIRATADGVEATIVFDI